MSLSWLVYPLLRIDSKLSPGIGLCGGARHSASHLILAIQLSCPPIYCRRDLVHWDSLRFRSIKHYKGAPKPTSALLLDTDILRHFAINLDRSNGGNRLARKKRHSGADYGRGTPQLTYVATVQLDCTAE